MLEVKLRKMLGEKYGHTVSSGAGTGNLHLDHAAPVAALAAHAAAPERVATVESVDIVIPSSMESDVLLLKNSSVADVNRDRNNSELKYTLRAIEKNAPWVRHIFILANGNQTLPDWVPQPEKTKMVNRCTLFRNPVDCPTR